MDYRMPNIGIFLYWQRKKQKENKKSDFYVANGIYVI